MHTGSMRRIVIAVALFSASIGAPRGGVAAAEETRPIAYLWRIPGPVRIDAPSCQALKHVRILVPFSASECLPYSDDDDPGPRVHIDTADVTGEQLVAEFLRQDPRYTAIIDQDWVVVLPTRAVRDPDYPLNVVVDRIAVEDVTIHKLASEVHLRVKETLGKDLRFLPNNPSPRRVVTLDVSSRTVRSILLDAAAAYGGSMEFYVDEDGLVEFLFNGFGVLDWSGFIESDQLSPGIGEILARRRRQGLRNSSSETKRWRNNRR